MEGYIDSDITILGGGPAGLAAALELGRKGIPCLLIDGCHVASKKICGDGLSGKVISALNNIDPVYTVELNSMPFVTPSYAVRFYSPKSKMAEIGFRSAFPALPPGFVCRRKHFDQFLMDKALAFPSVTFISETFIDKIKRAEGEFMLGDTDGRLNARTRLLLVATGSDRRVIRSIVPDYPCIHKEGIGVRAYFNHVQGLNEKNAIEIHFLKELLPWYLWIFPFKDGSANVGLALPIPLANKNPVSLKRLLFDLIDRYPCLKERFAGSQMNGRIEAHRLPYFTGRQPISGDNFMLLGDAAHLIDPFTGEGISHAMISGHLAAGAAEQCLKKGDFSRKVTRGYEEIVYDKLGPELELGLRLHELARKPGLLNLVIGRASKNEKVRKSLEEMLYSVNSKGKLSQPMYYLKLMMGI